MGTGGIVAIVIGSVVVVALIISLIVKSVKKKRNR